MDHGQTRFADVDGVRIAFEVRGDRGPWLLLIHGLGYARWGWEPVADLLAERFRVVLFDNRGIGASDVPPGPYSAAQMAGDALAVLDAAGVDRAHVVGTSLGGMIAQELVLAALERVDRLVLVSTTPGGDRAHPIPEPTQQLIADLPSLPPAEGLRRAVENALTPQAVTERPDLVDRIMAHRLALPQDPAGWQAQAAAGTTYDGGDRIQRVTVPTLIVQGTDDAVIDARNADVLADLLPDVEVERFDGVGHLVYWEQPERFVRVITDFLEG